MFVPYRHIIIEDPLDAPTSQELAGIERELGVHLPAEFVEFLKLAQGGTIEYIFRAPSDPEGETFALGDIYRIGKDDKGGYGYHTLLGELHLERQYKRLPKQVLPFARGDGDVILYLDLTPEGNGRVVAFLEGLPAWTGKSQQSAFFEVAPSFSAFIDALKPNEQNWIELLQNALQENNTEAIAYNRAFLDLAIPDWKSKYPQLSDNGE